MSPKHRIKNRSIAAYLLQGLYKLAVTSKKMYDATVAAFFCLSSV